MPWRSMAAHFAPGIATFTCDAGTFSRERKKSFTYFPNAATFEASTMSTPVSVIGGTLPPLLNLSS